MRRLPRSNLFILVEYVLALLSIGLTTGVLRLLGSVLDTQIATVGYLVPVVVSTLAWGLGPGIGIAGTLLTRRMIPLAGGGLADAKDVSPATGDETVDSVLALCTDFTGAVSGIRVGLAGV